MATVESLFGRTFECECGKTHTIQPREVIYERGAAGKVPELCARGVAGRRVAVIMDRRTRAVMGAEVAQALSAGGWHVKEVIVADPAPGHSPICDDVTQQRVSAEVGEVDLLVPVGSGVITDLARWTCLQRKLPFVSVATAASMNGYASSNIAATIKGVKSVLYAGAPAAVAADPVIIENAPEIMTGSGLGDILAKPISSADWRLNQMLFGDYYCPRSVNLIAEIEPLYMEHPEALRAREPRAIEALFHGLLLTGVAMTMAETSSPASGGEHMVSHVLDMMASLDGTEHDMHGRQVGLGVILCSEIYRRVLAIESPKFVAPSSDIDRRFWGKLADGVASEYEGKVERLRSVPAILSKGDTWDRVRATLSPMLHSPEAIQRCLREGGGAWRAEDIGCDRRRLTHALLHGHEIRSRFTILDLARLLGVMPEAAGEIVEAWS